jgi:hypothetical protein
LAFATAKLKNKKATRQEKNTKIDEFVIEKSKTPINNGMILLIENCSRGDPKIIEIRKKTKKIQLTTDLNHN